MKRITAPFLVFDFTLTQTQYIKNLTALFVYLYYDLLVTSRSLTHLLTHSLTYSVFHSLSHSRHTVTHTHSLTHSLTHLTHTVTQSHSCNLSLTHSLTHSHTHTLTHSHTLHISILDKSTNHEANNQTLKTKQDDTQQKKVNTP